MNNSILLKTIKPFLFTLGLFLFFASVINGQILYGTAGGSIIKYDVTTNTLTSVFQFTPAQGSLSNGGLIEGFDGKLYGTDYAGGLYNDGALYSFDPATSIYTKLLDFDGANGAQPTSSLFQAKNGKLYGMTSQGGSGTFKNGVIFSFDPVTKVYSRLVDLSQLSLDYGAQPLGHFTEGLTDGLLYGTMSSGGAYYYGLIFSYNTYTSVYTALKSFDDTTGANPYNSLTLAKNEKFYGMTAFGGLKNDGVLFSFDPANSAYSPLLSGNPESHTPMGDLLQATDGKLYGTAAVKDNIGTLFSFDPVTNVYKRLQPVDYLDFNFPGAGGLLQASNGLIYGTSIYGGSYNKGYIFSYDPATNVLQKPVSFNGIVSGNPISKLIEYKPATGLPGGTTANKRLSEEEPFKLKTIGNPSSGFNVVVQSKSNAPVELLVFDALGRPMYQTKGTASEVYSFGSQFTSGIYYVEVRQGINRQILKIVK